jgi:hypothetical protein
MNKLKYKFSTEKKMLAIVDRIEEGCQEQGLYYLGEGIEFNCEKDGNEKSVRMMLFDGRNAFLSVQYHVDKGDDNHTIVTAEYFRYSLDESKKAFNKMRELLVEHKGKEI